MYAELHFDDAASPLIRRIIAEKPQWFASSLKSAGYWASQEIKKGIRSGAPGGHQYARLMPSRMRRRLDEALGNEARRSYKALERMVRAVGYDKTRANEGVVTIGWLSASAVRIGTKQEKGFFTMISEHMRSAFAMARIPLSQGKTTITVVARPTYGPMKPVIDRGAPREIDKKLASYLKGNAGRSSAKDPNRIYRVYK